MNNLRTGITIGAISLLVCSGILSTKCYRQREAEKESIVLNKQKEEENLRNNNIMISLYQAKVSEDSLDLVNALKGLNGIDFESKEKKFEQSKDRLKMLKEFNTEDGKEQQISFPIIKIESVRQYNNLKNTHEYYFAETDSGTYACRNFDHAAIIEDGQTKYWLWSDNK